HLGDARLIAHALQERLKGVFALGLEAVVDLILLRQPLYDANGSQCFLGESGQQSRAGASFARCALDEELVAINDPEHQRGDRESSESEPPVDPEHQDRHSGQQQCVSAENDDAVGDEVLNRLNVGSQPGSQVARPLSIVETQGQTLHVSEQFPAQVTDKALTNVTYNSCIPVSGQTSDDCDEEYRCATPIHDVHVREPRGV